MNSWPYQGPISPEDIRERRQAAVPSDVFRRVNDILLGHFNDGQPTYVSKVGLAGPLGALEDPVLERAFEEAYRSVGWEVTSHPPPRGDVTAPYWLFSRKVTP